VQELGEVLAVLAGDAGDECARHEVPFVGGWVARVYGRTLG
jgi:hypothetical protein